MELTRRCLTQSSLLAAPALFLSQGSGMAQLSEMPATATSDARAIAIDAYVYGYSLMTTEVTRVQMSNVANIEGLHAPTGQFINVKRYPPANFRGVSAPNADTLYSIAWVDLSEPQVFSHPDMGERFYLFEMTDLWMTDFGSPGQRRNGGKAASYLLTGPDWSGSAPDGMQHIKCATRYMVILGRTYSDGSEKDYDIVNSLQAQYRIVPLGSYGKPYTPQAPAVVKPGFSMIDAPQKVLLDMPIAVYFEMMATLMGSSAPPAPDDAPILARIAKIGLMPGKPFDPSKLGAHAEELTDVPATALRQIEDHKKDLGGGMVNGWAVTKGLGAYGTDYMKRAVVAAFGWPANLQEDAVYPYADRDSAGQALTGARTYKLTFPKGETPPVKGFWSITMYEIDKGWWFVPNPLNRFTASMRNNPVFDPDGSLTLLFQNESPGRDKEANWLPAPKGDFLLMLRMYWPSPDDPSILDGSWKPPAVERVS